MQPPNRLLRDSVGLATGFVREQWRFVLQMSALAAVATAAFAALSETVPAASFITTIGAVFAQTAVYAVFVCAALMGTNTALRRWLSDSGRVWAAMVVVGFFLFLVMFALSLPVSMLLFSGSFATELQNAGSDSTRVMALFERFATANPGPVLAAGLIFFIVWMLITSRFYLAAPATVEHQRIQTFETWPWTRGLMLRITGARLLLLGPAYILAGALGHLVGRALGVNTLDLSVTAASSGTNPVGFIGYVLLGNFIMFALFSSLEAGLSAHIYRLLRPPAR